MVTQPSWWFPDRVTVTHRGQKTATGFAGGTTSETLRCKFYGHGKTEWVDGVETRRGDAYFKAKLLPLVVRSVTRVEEVIVPPRNVGDRLPSPAFPYPSDDLYPDENLAVFRAELIPHTDTFATVSVHNSDTVTYRDKTYVVYDIQTFYGSTPYSPSHILVFLKDRR